MELFVSDATLRSEELAEAFTVNCSGVVESRPPEMACSVMTLVAAGVAVVVRKLTVIVFAGLGEVFTEAGEKSHDTPVGSGAPEQLKVANVGNELVTVNVAALLGLP